MKGKMRHVSFVFSIVDDDVVKPFCKLIGWNLNTVILVITTMYIHIIV